MSLFIENHNESLFVTFCPVPGHGDIFSCCQNDNLRGLPVSFFMIHILGGMVLFMTDGIVVSAFHKRNCVNNSYERMQNVF